MATPTEEEINKKQETLHKKRQQVFDAEARQAANLDEVAREQRMAALEAEEERLDARLERAREAAKKSNVREGAERPTEQVSDPSPRPEAPKSSADKKEG